MANGKGKNTVIGFFVFVALCILVFAILYLSPRAGDEGQVLFVRFSDVDKINKGTKVTLSGRNIGKVEEITEIPDAREGRKDEFNHFYIYLVKLLIDSHEKIYNTDEITVRTSGLLGEKSIVIIPKPPQPGQIPHLVTQDEILYAVPSGSVEETMNEFKEVAEKVNLMMDSLTITLEDVRKEEIVKKIGTFAQNLAEITDALNQPEELAGIIGNIQDFSSELAKRLPPSWDMFDKSLHTLNDTTDNARNFTGRLDDIAMNVSRGQGTIGELLVKDDLYLRLTSLLSKGEIVFDDINHYGLLFNLDKGWQRLRARRLNLLQKLSTPQEFRNYFNDEINQITTSLARVGMVMENVESCCPCHPLIEDPNFAKVFAELLRRVGELEETLKLYNQEIVRPEVELTELVEY